MVHFVYMVSEMSLFLHSKPNSDFAYTGVIPFTSAVLHLYQGKKDPKYYL